MQLNQDIDWRAALHSSGRWTVSAFSWVKNGVVQSLPSRLQHFVDPPKTTQTNDHATLDSDRVFWTSISVPRSMGGRLKEVATLQLSQLSPLPPEEVSFALAPARITEADRIAAPVAIARRQALQDLRAEYTLGESGAIRTVNTDGAEAIFGGNTHSKETFLRILSSKALATIIVFVALVIAASTYFNRIERGAMATRSDLAPQIKQAASLKADVERIEASTTLYSPTELLTPLRSAPLPEDLIIEQIRLLQGRVQLSGWAPIGADLTPLRALGPLSIQNDPRDGWNRIAVSWAMEDSL